MYKRQDVQFQILMPLKQSRRLRSIFISVSYTHLIKYNIYKEWRNNMNDIKRVILKLSGEALSGDKKSGYDDELIMDIAGQVKQIIDKGINVGVVIGGGNYWRGRSNDNIDRTKADQIGMLATIMNCIYVSEIFRSQGLKTNILTPFECGSMTKLFSKDRANKYFEKGRCV